MWLKNVSSVRPRAHNMSTDSLIVNGHANEKYKIFGKDSEDRLWLLTKAGAGEDKGNLNNNNKNSNKNKNNSNQRKRVIQ